MTSLGVNCLDNTALEPGLYTFQKAINSTSVISPTHKYTLKTINHDIVNTIPLSRLLYSHYFLDYPAVKLYPQNQAQPSIQLQLHYYPNCHFYLVILSNKPVLVVQRCYGGVISRLPHGTLSVPLLFVNLFLFLTHKHTARYFPCKCIKYKVQTRMVIP